MTCVHDTRFAVETSPTVFGRGALEEVGDHAASFDLNRVALFTDENLSRAEHVKAVKRSLDVAGVDTVVYAEVCVEPTDSSFLDAARFAREGRFDGFVMKVTDMPNGLKGVGYSEDDVDALTDGAYPQRRLLDNAPVDIDKEELKGIYRDALKYW